MNVLAIVSLNHNTGVLSNANLRSIALQQGVSAERYDQLFSPQDIDWNGDGTFSTSELGTYTSAQSIAQPGGSVNDYDAIVAANEVQAAMVFTLERCFSHH